MTKPATKTIRGLRLVNTHPGIWRIADRPAAGMFMRHTPARLGDKYARYTVQCWSWPGNTDGSTVRSLDAAVKRYLATQATCPICQRAACVQSKLCPVCQDGACETKSPCCGSGNP